MPRQKRQQPNYFAPLIAEWFQQGLSEAEIDIELKKLQERETLKVKLVAEKEAEKGWVEAVKTKNAEKRRRLDARGFHKFSLLPIELQVMIWKEAMENEPLETSRVWPGDTYYDLDDYNPHRRLYPWELELYPWENRKEHQQYAFLSTCRLSRLLALQKWIVLLDEWLDIEWKCCNSELSDDWCERSHEEDEGIVKKWKVVLVDLVNAM